MDELVASAVSHWAPRFTTNGVAVADFERVTSGLKDWDGWCSAWSQVGAEYEALGAEAVEEGRLRSAGQHYVQAAVCHHFGKFLFVQDPVRMREAHLAAVRCLDAALPHLDPPGRRVEIPFDGSRLVGVLRLPRGPGPHPVTVMIPGLDSAKEEFRSTEALFLERGVGTFSVDGPGQGEAEYDLAIRGDWEVPGGAILDAVSAEPDVDPDRLAVWGSASAATTPLASPVATAGCAPVSRSPDPTTSASAGSGCRPSPGRRSAPGPGRRATGTRARSRTRSASRGGPPPSPARCSWSPAGATGSSRGSTPSASPRRRRGRPGCCSSTRATTGA
ncbi:alpha/beta hydrolase [Streptosporangium lutulentum]